MAGQQNDWSQWLMIATAVHNDWTNETLGITPNEALFGFQPTLFPAQPIKTSNELAKSRIDRLHQKRTQATAAINHAASHPFVPSTVFRENDQVWLESKHLALPHQSKKLAPKRVGPFHITWIISPVAFRLELPLSWGIHDVFHVSLLTKYEETTAHGPNFSRPPPNLVEGEDKFKVEAIINHRLHGCRRQLQYLVKWVGYPQSDNTWEPIANIHAPDLIRNYQRQKGKV